MTFVQENKKVIRSFMQEHYTDERLAQLLAHAQEGKLSYHSCCCFIGIVTADHVLRGMNAGRVIFSDTHVQYSRALPKGNAAENAFRKLAPGFAPGFEDSLKMDAGRRRILIPMIRAEMKRRENLRKKTEVAVEQYVTA